MTVSSLFLLKMNQSQTARAKELYVEAGSVVYTTVSSTILSLNAVKTMIAKFRNATLRAYEGAAGVVLFVGLANGAVFGSFLLAYIPVTLYGSWLLYDAVCGTGCDPSGTEENNAACSPSGVDVFGSQMGITFAAAVLPQVAVTVDAFSGARNACYSALEIMKRRVGDKATSYATPEDNRLTFAPTEI